MVIVFSIAWLHFAGNKAKRANLKTGVTRKQSTPNFPKKIMIKWTEDFFFNDYIAVEGSTKTMQSYLTIILSPSSTRLDLPINKHRTWY